MSYPNPPRPDDEANESAGGYQTSDVPPASPYGSSPYGSPSPYDAPSTDAYGTPTPSAYGTPTPSAYGPTQPSPYGTPPPAYSSPYVQQPPDYQGAYASGGASTTQNGLGVWSLVLGLVGLLLCGLPAIGGLVLGIQGRAAAKRGTATNGGLATAGLVISIVALAFWVLGGLSNIANG